jgi:hypothetical protein
LPFFTVPVTDSVNFAAHFAPAGPVQVTGTRTEVPLILIRPSVAFPVEEPDHLDVEDLLDPGFEFERGHGHARDLLDDSAPAFDEAAEIDREEVGGGEECRDVVLGGLVVTGDEQDSVAAALPRVGGQHCGQEGVCGPDDAGTGRQASDELAGGLAAELGRRARRDISSKVTFTALVASITIWPTQVRPATASGTLGHGTAVTTIGAAAATATVSAETPAPRPATTGSRASGPLPLEMMTLRPTRVVRPRTPGRDCPRR